MQANNTSFKDKFIGFVDILGFKQMVEMAEAGTGRALEEILEIQEALGRETNKRLFRAQGPTFCPMSATSQRDLDFEITQISDCAIVSSEISPGGVVNLIGHCWSIALALLIKGVLVRGYITRGKVYHKGSKVVGSGYQNAYQNESSVAAFKRHADEIGTPFIQIDGQIDAYVRNETDDCVREMYDRFVKSDGELIAIFPFQRLHHSFLIGGYGTSDFDPGKEKRNNNVMRQYLITTKSRLLKYIDRNDEKAMRKIEHYIAALDHQLEICEQTDVTIDGLTEMFIPPNK